MSWAFRKKVKTNIGEKARKKKKQENERERGLCMGIFACVVRRTLKQRTSTSALYE